ncbi:MAG: NUDIX domain-containing protein [Paracoccaceae bacterium]
MATDEEAAFRRLGPWAAWSPYRGALIIPVDRAGRVLLQLRDHNPAAVHPGEWGLFGGEAEPGESLAEAAAREFLEETEIALPLSAFKPFARIVSPVSLRRLYAFEVVLEAAARDIRLNEGAGFGFIEPADFPRLDMVAAARIILAAWTGADQSQSRKIATSGRSAGGIG